MSTGEYLNSQNIEPGTVSNATTDDAILDAVHNASGIGTVNIRDEAVSLKHFAATRDATAAACSFPITTWCDHLELSTGTQTIDHNETTPQTVTLNAIEAKLTPPAGARGTLNAGDVLRYHFRCNVLSVNDAGAPDADTYTFYLQVTGTDSTGTHGKRTLDGTGAGKLGLPATASMNQGGLPLGDPAIGTVNQPIGDTTIAFSGIYIHDPANESVFSPAGTGGPVHIDNVKVLAFVADNTNSIEIATAFFVAFICQG